MISISCILAVDYNSFISWALLELLPGEACHLIIKSLLAFLGLLRFLMLGRAFVLVLAVIRGDVNVLIDLQCLIGHY